MATSVEGGPVKSHVQAFADAGYDKFRTRFTTYPTHSPTRDRALDCWDTDQDIDALVEFGRRHHDEYGIDYIIWQQRIWNPEILDDWRWMADRHSRTANHWDHAHFAFEPDGRARPDVNAPGHTSDTPPFDPMPMIAMGDKGDAVSYCQRRLVAHGHNVYVDGDFGPITRARVQIHQSAWRLIPDGIVGPKTWPTLIINL